MDGAQQSTRASITPVQVPRPSIVLLQMPWSTTGRPSIALGILTQLCAAQSVASRTLYPNMDLRALVGPAVYDEFSNNGVLFGLSEHLCAADLFGASSLKSDAYVERLSRSLKSVPGLGAWAERYGDLDFLRHIRDAIIPQFLERTLVRVLDDSPTVVGFTATFNQVMASLALAARIKRQRPSIQIIVGGACFDGEMGPEYHRALPHVIDHVFLGEAEVSFREYLECLQGGQSGAGIRGVTSYINGAIQLTPHAPLADLNQSPAPNYDDYFSERERTRYEANQVIPVESLPFESSRGCWWGQTNHCIFCGINDELMTFRSKTVERVVQEVATLAERYHVLDFTATDWILSQWHYGTLFRRLEELDLDLAIFYELRPTLKKAQIKAMRAAGIVHVQAGIESFSTPLLALMKKHTLGIRQVQFLRWCKEASIKVSYNILAGFPGEKGEWYLEMADLIPRIMHLPPPVGNVSLIEMHRFAPLYEQRGEFGIAAYDMRGDYQANFPEGTVDQRKIAYFFEHTSSLPVAESAYVDRLSSRLGAWLEAHKGISAPLYEYRMGPGFLDIVDGRSTSTRVLKLTQLHRDVVLLCDEVKTRRSLEEDLRQCYQRSALTGKLDQVLEELCAADVLLSEGNSLLTLPIAQRFRSTEELRARVFHQTSAAHGSTGWGQEDHPLNG